jgi:hypothetical protein
MTKTQIFFQCPHRCSSVVDLEDGLTRLMFAGAHGRDILGTVKRLVPSILEINGKFIKTKLLMRINIANVVSTAEDPSQRVSVLSWFAEESFNHGADPGLRQVYHNSESPVRNSGGE